MRESDLYHPVKALLEAQGYVVKSEIGDCDVMAQRGGEPPVIVELKLTFSLALVMQGVARQRLFDQVYLAVPVSSDRGWVLRYKDIIALCRRLGLGLLAVRLGDTPRVEVHLDPGPYAPRKAAAKAGRLLREFDRRVGDPNLGGTTGVARMTAYRQDALRCAQALQGQGPLRPAALAKCTGVSRAAAIVRADHYGWFEKTAPATYALTPKGAAALVDCAPEVAALDRAVLLPLSDPYSKKSVATTDTTPNSRISISATRSPVRSA